MSWHRRAAWRPHLGRERARPGRHVPRRAAATRGRRGRRRRRVSDGPILVVDDDPSILAVVSQILDFEGYPVQTATDGAEALAAVNTQRPSLVLLDMRMPVLDGWGFARALAARGEQLPIV